MASRYIVGVVVLVVSCVFASSLKKPNPWKHRVPAPTEAPWKPGLEIYEVSPEDRMLTQPFMDGVLIPPHTVPFLNDLWELKLNDGVLTATDARTAEESTIVYLGTRGRCQIELELKHNATARGEAGTKTVLPGPKQSVVARRGRAIVVFPGMTHSVSLIPDDSKNCQLLRFDVASGRYDWSRRSGYTVSDFSDLAEESARYVEGRHNAMHVTKRAFLKNRDVPGVFQLSISELDAGSSSKPHVHPTATEIFVSYEGWGCGLTTVTRTGDQQDINLLRGKVVAVGAGTEITSYNTNSEGSCLNVNLILGNPKPLKA